MMNILLPTDFSSNSRNAAAYALQFFKEVPCTFHFLHVLPVGPGTEAGNSSLIPTEIQEKFDDLILWLSEIRENREHDFSTSFKINYLIEAVRQQVTEKNIDLILMGTKGATNKKGDIVGKNTSDVMMKVKCPAMAISEKASFKTHKEVLFPTDYRIHYSEKMLNTLLILTRLSKASVKILELFSSEGEPSDEQLANKIFLEKSFSPNIPHVETHYPIKSRGTANLFKSNPDVDMIVMAAKNINLCQKLLKSKSQKNIPFINKLPLLVLHD